MATTLTNATLTVTLTETITLNNEAINSQNKLEIPNINEIDKRIMSIGTASETTIVQFSTAPAAGTFVRNDIKYIRLTNKDSVNYARIRVKKNGADTFDVKLDAGQNFIMSNTKINTSDTAASFVTYEDADSISAQADSQAVDIEYFVAST